MNKQYLVPKNRKKPIQEKLQLEYPKLFFQWDMFVNGCCEIRSWKIIEYINDNYEILYSYFPFLNKINLKNFCVDYETKLQ